MSLINFYLILLYGYAIVFISFLLVPNNVFAPLEENDDTNYEDPEISNITDILEIKNDNMKNITEDFLEDAIIANDFEYFLINKTFSNVIYDFSEKETEKRKKFFGIEENIEKNRFNHFNNLKKFIEKISISEMNFYLGFPVKDLSFNYFNDFGGLYSLYYDLICVDEFKKTAVDTYPLIVMKTNKDFISKVNATNKFYERVLKEKNDFEENKKVNATVLNYSKTKFFKEIDNIRNRCNCMNNVFKINSIEIYNKFRLCCAADINFVKSFKNHRNGTMTKINDKCIALILIYGGEEILKMKFI